VRVFDRRRWGKSSVARAALSRLEAADLVAVRLPLDEYPTASACHPYCTMLLAKHAAELVQSFGTVTTSVIRLALPTVQKHEAWRLR
jgi:hypothetical protein